MSFLTTIETDAQAIETDVVAGLKTALTYVDNIVVTDVIPELESALATALTTFGQTLLAQVLGLLSPGATITVPTPPAE